MQNTICCKHCKKEVPANPRLKGNQQYCNDSECQKARKREWYQARIQSDSGYATRQKQCKERWRKFKPAHAYQKAYRETHPDYVQRNRELQIERNRKRRLLEKENASKIVKIDKFDVLQEKSNTYRMRIIDPVVSKKIVKIDSLLVELQPYQGIIPSSG